MSLSLNVLFCTVLFRLFCLEISVNLCLSVDNIEFAGTALANWCNDMLTDGCANGSQLLPVREAGDNVARVEFSLTDLRLQRATTIWGDAFRRPFTYQPLCFRNGSHLRVKHSSQQGEFRSFTMCVCVCVCVCVCERLCDNVLLIRCTFTKD